jgi:PAS domain S-box-containing protein
MTDFLDEDDVNYRRLFHAVLITVVLSCLATMAGMVMSGDRTPTRYLTLLTLSVVMGISYWQLQHSIRRGAQILALGIWASLSASTIAYAGIHSANGVAYAFLIVFTGWMLGRRWLIGVSGATIVLLAALGATEYFGIYHASARAHVLVVGAVVLGTLIATAYLTEVFYSSLTQRRDRALSLSDDLALQNQLLADRERDLEMMMNHVPAGICSFDADSRLRIGNARYAALFGARPEELVGRHVADYVSADALKALMEQWGKCLDGGARGSYRRTNLDPATGETRILDIDLVPEFIQGQVTGLFGLLIDVTEKVASEARIRELNEARELLLVQTNEALEAKVAERTRHLQTVNAELDNALRQLKTAQAQLVQSGKMAALGSMVAGVAHEMNTPIGNARLTATAITDIARHLQSTLRAGAVSRKDLTQGINDLEEGAKLIDSSLVRASDLIESFKKIAVNRASNRRRPFLLSNVIKESLEMMTPTLAECGVTVRMALPAEVNMLSCPEELGQVLCQLMENALVHGYAGATSGVIDIAVDSPHADRVCIAVVDHGHGIPADALGRVFDPFFTSRMGQGGGGLGLSIAYGLVTKSLGGDISVSSTLGLGTVVKFDLPLTMPL